jgi:hypothetical protein
MRLVPVGHGHDRMAAWPPEDRDVPIVISRHSFARDVAVVLAFTIAGGALGGTVIGRDLLDLDTTGQICCGSWERSLDLPEACSPCPIVADLVRRGGQGEGEAPTLAKPAMTRRW